MASTDYALKIIDSPEISNFSRVNDPQFAFNTEIKESGSFKNSLVKKFSMAGVVIFSSMSTGIVFSESATVPSIELKQNVANDDHNNFDFSRTQTVNSLNLPLYTLNKTIDTMEIVEELGLGRVDRIQSDYQPKIKKIAKPVKRGKLNFNNSLENTREVYY